MCEDLGHGADLVVVVADIDDGATDQAGIGDGVDMRDQVEITDLSVVLHEIAGRIGADEGAPSSSWPRSSQCWQVSRVFRQLVQQVVAWPLRGRNAAWSLVATSPRRPANGPSSPPITSQTTTPTAGSTQINRLRDKSLSLRSPMPRKIYQ